MNINIPLVLEIIPQVFNITDQAISGLKEILENIQKDNNIRSTKWVAYMLATAWHETAFTMTPIDEYGSDNYFEKRYGYNTKVGRILGNIKRGDGTKYHGRGYVQLTGKYNYNRVGNELNLDLVNNPDMVKEPNIAYSIMSTGMINGWFTGKKLEDYINSSKTDYVNARKIINGVDRATNIANYAKKFEAPLL